MATESPYDAPGMFHVGGIPADLPCPCDCFECRVDRHDICRHVIRCIKRPAKSAGLTLVPERQQ